MLTKTMKGAFHLKILFTVREHMQMHSGELAHNDAKRSDRFYKKTIRDTILELVTSRVIRGLALIWHKLDLSSCISY